MTTVSDVYSLGVVLDELLTGSWPYLAESNTPDDIARAVKAQTPRRPSNAVGGSDTQNRVATKAERGRVIRQESLAHRRRELAGDLDAIEKKALERDVLRRYSSAEQFAEDIRRFLSGEPVQARLPTLTYRAKKFVRRNAVVVSAAALIAIASVVAVAWIVRAERTATRGAYSRRTTF